MNADEESVRVQLARMEGKLDLSNMRHDKTDERLNVHEQRLHRHSNDISNLQAKALLHEGERKGLALGGRILWLVGGAMAGGGGIAGLMKLLGS